MYSNVGDLGIIVREQPSKLAWHRKKEEKPHNNGKRFVRCLCPKCSIQHSVYMLWTGRGVPRKYCVNCKPLVAGYDEAAIYENSISTPGHSRRKGSRFDSE